MKRGKPFSRGARVVDEAGMLWIVESDQNWRRVVCKSAETPAVVAILRRSELKPAQQPKQAGR